MLALVLASIDVMYVVITSLFENSKSVNKTMELSEMVC